MALALNNYAVPHLHTVIKARAAPKCYFLGEKNLSTCLVPGAFAVKAAFTVLQAELILLHPQLVRAGRDKGSQLGPHLLYVGGI